MRRFNDVKAVVLVLVGLCHAGFMVALYFYLHGCAGRLCARDQIMMRIDALVNAPLRDLYGLLTGYRLSISEKPSFIDSAALFAYDFLAPLLLSSLALGLIYLLLNYLVGVSGVENGVEKPSL